MAHEHAPRGQSRPRAVRRAGIGQLIRCRAGEQPRPVKPFASPRHVQVSTRSPTTLLNSSWFLVTTIASSANSIAAIVISLAPMTDGTRRWISRCGRYGRRSGRRDQDESQTRARSVVYRNWTWQCSRRADVCQHDALRLALMAAPQASSLQWCPSCPVAHEPRSPVVSPSVAANQQSGDDPLPAARSSPVVLARCLPAAPRNV